MLTGSYTISLTIPAPILCNAHTHGMEKYRHPDFQMVLNLPQEHICYLLNTMGIRVQGGETFHDGDMVSGIYEDSPRDRGTIRGNIDLGIISAREDYRKLKKSFVIFICTFDPFGDRRHLYTFENRCIENPSLTLGDETTKIFLNTKGNMCNKASFSINIFKKPYEIYCSTVILCKNFR